METNEALRGRGWSRHRKLKLKGLLAVRSGIKAKRVRQNGNPAYSREIVEAARGITGRPLWLAGQVLVELRDFYLFGFCAGPGIRKTFTVRTPRRAGGVPKKSGSRTKELQHRWPPG